METKEKIKQGLRKAIFKATGLRAAKIELEQPENASYGEWSSNFAMTRFKELRDKNIRSPLELAQKVVDNFAPLKTLERIEAVPPGFINFHLSPRLLQSQIKQILVEKEKYGSNKNGKGKVVVIDYSSPNIAKPFGIGHLRSTIIGQAIYNLFKFSGYKIIGDNHLGDWGTQFGKLIYAIKAWSDPKKISQMSVKDLVDLYVRFHDEAEKKPELEEEGRLWFKKLEGGDKEAKKIWQQCTKISLKEFERVYKLLGIKIDYAFAESYYKDKTSELIEEAKRLGIAKKSRGALVIKVGREIPPVLLLKTDEATTYHTRDLAAIKFRQKKFGPLEEIIYEVGADHKLHFIQLFSAAKKFPWGRNLKYTHIAHGMMRLQGGKMSTRKGQIIPLEDILLEAIKRAKEIVEKNNPEMKKSEKEKIAKTIGIGAVKYNDLSQHYDKDIIFSWERMLNLQGNSAPYLQYTIARAKSILTKSETTDLGLKNFDEKKLTHQKETMVIKLLARFPEIIQKAAANYSPNLICNYLFTLAQNFNNLYETVPVLNTKDKALEKARLALVVATSQVMENGLRLLGIASLEKM